MWGGARRPGSSSSSRRPLVAAGGVAAVAAALVLGLAVLSPSSWQAVLRGAGWGGPGDEMGLVETIQAVGVATEKEVKATFPVPGPLTTSNLPLSGYLGSARRALNGCIVRGPGVEQPSTAGRRNYLVVVKPRGGGGAGDGDDDDDGGWAGGLSEEGEAAWATAEYAYATFENEEGAFGAWSEKLDGELEDSFRIEFWPPRPGTFKLTVDLISKNAVWPVHDKRDATIEVLPPEDESSPINENRAPGHCGGSGAALPDTRAFWYKCATAPGLPHPEECLRWGYTFRPNHGRCYYEAWTGKDLVAYATDRAAPKQWILVTGTSRLRGVFLSAADHLLEGRRGEFEAISKCWGRMDVEVGNLRLTFQDFRAQDVVSHWPIPAEERRFQCHGDKQASYDDAEYAHNSTLFVRNIFDAADQGRVPTHLVFEYIESQSPQLYKDVLFGAIPVEWQGGATGVYFRSVKTGGMDSPPLDRGDREAWVKAATGGRENVAVRLVDTLEIIRPWLRLGEFGTNRASQHWHSCTKAPPPPPPPTDNATDTAAKSAAAAAMKDWVWTTKPVPFAVQGLVTDQLAQMVFNAALGPRPPRNATAALAAAIKQQRAATDAADAPYRPGLKVCMDCPPQLLPFNVKPRAALACHAELPVTEFKSHYVPVLPECPAWCLAQPVESVTETKSGPVEVRDCSEAEKEGDREGQGGDGVVVEEGEGAGVGDGKEGGV